MRFGNRRRRDDPAGEAATSPARAGERTSTRPAKARRAASAVAPRPALRAESSRLTGRATALVLVLIALMLAYAYPVRLYLDQQAEIQRLEVNQAAQRATIGALQNQTAKWDDPAYIKAQARARFQMVKPGEKAYLVLSPPAAGTTGTQAPSTAAAHPTWYGQLWAALRAADRTDTP